MVNHPVLFETFARVETSRKVWEQIKKAQPKQLYFYSNKGRNDKGDEIARNEQIRAFAKEVDWECDLHTWFRDDYVDVYTSLKDSKRWLFSQVDDAIILEDDCYPSLAFFTYCDYFLDYYKNNKEISFVSGNNYVKNVDYKGADHLVTRTFYCYGWATWKDRWENVDFEMEADSFCNYNMLKTYFDGNSRLAFIYKEQYRHWRDFIHRTHCWDMQKTMTQVICKTYSVNPVYNLVCNIGINGEHTRNGSGPQFDPLYKPEDPSYPFTGIKYDLTKHSQYEVENAKIFGEYSLKHIIGLSILNPIRRLLNIK